MMISQDSELKQKLAAQSQEAIKSLIVTAEKSRRDRDKQTNFLKSFFKEAKKYIV